MVEGTDTGWLVVLEKNGLGPAAAILENYGIDSESPCMEGNSSAGVELCVNVRRTCCLRR